MLMSPWRTGEMGTVGHYEALSYILTNYRKVDSKKVLHNIPLMPFYALVLKCTWY